LLRTSEAPRAETLHTRWAELVANQGCCCV
jgi:hypothetical protein